MSRRPLQVAVFCHVESGTVRDRTIVFDRRAEEGITQSLPRIAEFAEQEGIPICLALTPQALAACPIDLAGHPLGLHVHPQDPVLVNRLETVARDGSDCLAHFPFDTQSRLISIGAEVYTEVVGRRPTVFVAGNWSENADTLKILETLGVLIDGSALPGYSSSCADWRRVPRLAQPYRASSSDPQVPGDSQVLLVPVYRGFWGDYLSPENAHYLGVPYFRAALTEANVGGAEVVHIYFHSPMVLDPYFLTAFSKVVEYARDRIHAQFIPPENVKAATLRTSRPFPPAYLAFMDRMMLKSLLARRAPSLVSQARRATASETV